jgi:hypothetical protein
MTRYEKVLKRANMLASRPPVSDRDIREITELREIMRQIQKEDTRAS